MKVYCQNNINNINFSAYKISKKRAQHLENEFKKANSIDILTHESTDRDGANSALVLSDYLTNLGIQSRVIVSQKNIQDLGLKTKNQEIVQAKDFKNKNADAVICVDFSKVDRLPESLVPYLIQSKKVFCFDHHSNPNIGEATNNQYTLMTKPNKHSISSADKETTKSHDKDYTTPIYIDTSAKSAAGIIYRYFEALGKDLDDTQAYNLFAGFVDDTQKRGMLTCDGEKGTIKPNKKLFEDANSYEIFEALKSRMSDEQIAQIAKNIDVLSSLTDEEQKFKDSLTQRMQLSPNGKIAYVEIPPDDEEWKNLGMDNARTSTIMNRFRQSILRNDFNDERLNDVKTAITFYRAGNMYRMSLHSKENSLLDFFKYIEENKIPDFTKNAGGHQSRAGGKIYSVDDEKCHKWVYDIISSDGFYQA